MKIKLQKITLCAVLCLGLMSFSQTLKAQRKAFEIVLYPERFMAGTCLGILTDPFVHVRPLPYSPDLGTVSFNTVWNFRDHGIDDKAKSVLITAYSGVTLIFYNNADADGARGMCIVNLKQDVGGYLLDSFERTYEDNYIKVTYWKNGNSLNGQVSSFLAQ